MRNYLKKNKPIDVVSDMVEKEESVLNVSTKSSRGVFVLRMSALLLMIPIVFVFYIHGKQSQLVSEIGPKDIAFINAPEAAAVGRSVISIPVGVKKEHPFVPYRSLGEEKVSKGDIPSSLLVEPPEELNEGSEAARLLDTIVSGILYDKYSPSAILNIEGNDYLVKKGDVVNNYKVLNIMQDSVTVKLGNNTYKAGIGEILTEGDLNQNEVSNLNNKFGGER